jgi:hypothetical protein
MDGLKAKASATPPALIPAAFVVTIGLIRGRVFSKKRDFDWRAMTWKANPQFIC